MLESLSVSHFALIEEATVSFSPGFNVLSGETGAGKSILAGALGLLLGNRASSGMIQEGYSEARISGIFSLRSEDPAQNWLEERGIPWENGQIIIRRVLKESGRSNIFIQSIPVTLNDLSEFASGIVDIHSQHEHQSLLHVEKHIELLDRYAGIMKEVSELRILHRRVTDKTAELKDLTDEEARRRQEEDLLRFAVEEIDAAQLGSPEEEYELETEIKKLTDFEKIHTLLENFRQLMERPELGCLTSLPSAQQILVKISAYDNSLESLGARMEQAYLEVEDISETLSEYQRNTDFSPERLNNLQERLGIIHRLQKKYSAPSIEALLEYKNRSEHSLADFDSMETRKEEIQKEIRHLETNLEQKASQVSQRRKEASLQLKTEIEANLAHLGMNNACFETLIELRKNAAGKTVYAPTGKDAVEFRIAANRGSTPQALKKVASGGEISRIMLAIKSILAKDDSISTLVFDEIDTGIGGEVSVSVGAFLKKIAENCQVLSITHLASIAVYADNQIKVSKFAENGATRTAFATVEGKARVEEVARMLAGDSWDRKSLEHAEEMLTRKR